MIINSNKQDLTEEVESADTASLNDEELKSLSGGIGGIGPFRELEVPPMPKDPDEPKDGGATGSW